MSLTTQSLRRGDVEAATAARRVRVDDHESVLVGEGRVLGARKVRLRRTGAVVNRDDQRQGTSELGGLVDVHAHVVGVGADVGRDLLQLVLSAIDGGDGGESSDDRRSLEDEHFRCGLGSLKGLRDLFSRDCSLYIYTFSSLACSIGLPRVIKGRNEEAKTPRPNGTSSVLLIDISEDSRRGAGATMTSD